MDSHPTVFSFLKASLLQRPLACCAIALLAGTLAGACFPFPFEWLIATLAILLLTLLHPKGKWGKCGLLLLFATLSASHAANVQSRIHTERVLLAHHREEKKILTVETTIGDDVRMVCPLSTSPYLTFTGKDTTFLDHTPWENTTLSLNLYTSDDHINPLPKRGERWRFAFHPYNLRNPSRVKGRTTLNVATPLAEENATTTLSYFLGTLRAAFARHLTYGLSSAQSSDPETLRKRYRHIAEARRDEQQFLVTKREKGESLDLTLTVDPESYRIVHPKNAPAYCIFDAYAPRVEDVRPIHYVSLRVHYRDPEGNFPRPNERWRLTLTFNRAKSRTPKRMTARTTAATSQRLATAQENPFPVIPEKRPEETDPSNEPFDPSLPLKSILLGAHYKLPYDLAQRFADVGIIHIFAISGLHVGILIGFLFFFLRYTFIPKRWLHLLLIPILIGYLLLTEAPPSATRATLMALILIGAVLFRRRFDAATTLMCAALFAIVNPLWLFNVGALLSFCVMGGILLFIHPFTHVFAKCLRAAPTFEEPHPIHFTCLKRYRYRLAQLLALTFSAWLSALPLCLHFFGRLSLIGLLLNLFIPFLAVIIVWSATISALIGFILPWGSALLNRLSATLLIGINDLSEIVSNWPYASIEFSAHLHGSITILLELLLLIWGLKLQVWIREENKTLYYDHS